MNAKLVEPKSLKDLEIQYFRRSELIKSASNARTHSESQIADIVASIHRFGWTNPILLDEERRIIAGHGRLMAAAKLEIDPVPCIVLAGLTENEKRLYLLADNKIPGNAAWDPELLALELADLQELGEGLEITGFSVDEIDAILEPKKEKPKAEKEEQFVEQFAVVVLCTDEGHQSDTFTALDEMGYNAKKVTDKK